MPSSFAMTPRLSARAIGNENSAVLMNKRLKVLAVNSRFAPVNAADSHRLRLLLPHAASCGWDVEVLTVEPGEIPAATDAWLEQQLPSGVPVHRVQVSPLVSWFCNTLALRCFGSMYTKGNTLLATGNFDLVFFSTTDFLLHLLGPLWKQKFAVPFCMDYQDPWVNSYYDEHPSVPKPGGTVKYWLMHQVDKLAERYVVAACDGFLAVSADYLTALGHRYGGSVVAKPCLVRTFPAEPAEMQKVVVAGDAHATRPAQTWRYIGRGGADMAKAATAFFRAWERAIAAGDVAVDAIRFEARGTSYARADRAEPTLAPLVQGSVLAGNVTELTDRLAYGAMLGALAQSDALIVFGSDDAAYTASKIYPYLLAGRPLLAIFHRDSSVVGLMQQVGGGVCVAFSTDMPVDELAELIYRNWFADGRFRHIHRLDTVAFAPWTAAVQAAEMYEWFAAICSHRRAREKS